MPRPRSVAGSAPCGRAKRSKPPGPLSEKDCGLIEKAKALVRSLSGMISTLPNKENATALFAKLLSRLERAKSSVIVARTYLNAGIMLHNQKRDVQAAKLLKDAATLFDQHGETGDACKARAILAKSLVSEGRKGYPEKVGRGIKILSAAIQILRPAQEARPDAAKPAADLATALLWRGLCRREAASPAPFSTFSEDISKGVKLCANAVASDPAPVNRMSKLLRVCADLCLLYGQDDLFVSVVKIMIKSRRPIRQDNLDFHFWALASLSAAYTRLGLESQASAHRAAAEKLLKKTKKRSEQPSSLAAAGCVSLAKAMAARGDVNAAFSLLHWVRDALGSPCDGGSLSRSAGALLALAACYRELGVIECIAGVDRNGRQRAHTAKDGAEKDAEKDTARAMVVARAADFASRSFTILMRVLLPLAGGTSGMSDHALTHEIQASLCFAGRIFDFAGDGARAEHVFRKGCDLADRVPFLGALFNTQIARINRKMRAFDAAWDALHGARDGNMHVDSVGGLELEVLLQEGSLHLAQAERQEAKTALDAAEKMISKEGKALQRVARARALTRVSSLPLQTPHRSSAELLKNGGKVFSKSLDALRDAEALLTQGMGKGLRIPYQRAKVAYLRGILSLCRSESSAAKAHLWSCIDLSLSHGIPQFASDAAHAFISTAFSTPAPTRARTKPRKRTRKRGNGAAASTSSDELTSKMKKMSLEDGAPDRQDGTALACLLHASMGVYARQATLQALQAKTRLQRDGKAQGEVKDREAELEAAARRFHFLGAAAESDRVADFVGKRMPKNWTLCSLTVSPDKQCVMISRLCRSSDGARGAVLRTCTSRSGDSENKNTLLRSLGDFQAILKSSYERNADAKRAGRRQMSGSDKKRWWTEKRRLDRDLGAWLQNFQDRVLGGAAVTLMGKFQDDELQAALHAEAEAMATSAGTTKSRAEIFSIFISAVAVCSEDDSAPDEIIESIFARCLGFADRADAEASMARSKPFQNALTAGLKRAREFWLRVMRERGEATTRDARDFVLHANRHPTILVLSKELSHLPIEGIPALEFQSVSRVPCASFLDNLVARESARLASRRDWEKTYYVLNPDEDLTTTQATFETQFRDEPNWDGVCGTKPTREQYAEGLRDRDMFVYCGHSNGSKFLSGCEIRRINVRAIALLMGCSSGLLKHKGCYDSTGIVKDYLIGGCPAVLANLWDVTDKDIDRFSVKLLQSLKSGTPLPAAANAARSSCKLRYLNGVSPVCYGIPVSIGERGPTGQNKAERATKQKQRKAQKPLVVSDGPVDKPVEPSAVTKRPRRRTNRRKARA